MITGKPASFPTEEGAHFSSGREKARHAAERGAVGVITITTPMNEKSRPYQNRLNFLHAPRVAWLKSDGQPANTQASLKNSAYFSKEAAAILFEGGERTLDEVYADLEEDKSPKGFDLAYEIDFSKASEHKEITSPNVVGLLEGSDPKLKNEYVLFSAHSDHIGFAKTVKKDRINNGAMDNASGTSIMLETARLFSSMEQKPKRSILFVAVTAEEKGLLGSDYYAQNPTVPIENIVANVNLDMPLLTHEFVDLIAFGANHSDLQDSVSLATQKADMELAEDPWPQLNLFTRSDHYSFVKQGVPAVFLFPGLKSKDPEKAEGKAFNDFMANHYHKPSDELNAEFNWVAAKKFTEVNFHIGNTIANQAQKPKWNEDSFFGNTFGK
jgi:Zn-dependent M28 family amino/carboxypeptidase